MLKMSEKAKSEINKLLDEMYERHPSLRQRDKLIAALRRALEFINATSTIGFSDECERDIAAILKGENP